MLRTLVAGLALSMVFALGCGKETEKAKTPGAEGAPAEENTFKLELPDGATEVAKGASEKVTIGVERGDNLKGPIKLTVEAPQGVTLQPESPEIPADQSEVEVTVQVANDAEVGDKTINVEGEADGKKTSGKVMIKVTEAE